MSLIGTILVMRDDFSAHVAEAATATNALSIEAHIVAQAKKSAAELLRQGWTTRGSQYDLGHYPGDARALDARLGRMANSDELCTLESVIRERLDEGRPVASARPL